LLLVTILADKLLYIRLPLPDFRQFDFKNHQAGPDAKSLSDSTSESNTELKIKYILSSSDKSKEF
jgi:hypothetical protein